ncbi:MAG: signal peptide peptidase SppA [Candidatus Nanohalobium sp.]
MKLKIIAGLLILFTASAATLSLGGIFQGNSGKAALIKLSGSITPDSSGFGSSGITPAEVRQLNQKVRNGDYDAVIYEINSGGGAVVASKEIKRSIESMDIPTVCRFRDISASGAYLISMGCDKIVADSATITGSVGVKSSYMQFSGAMDKLGIRYINITAGKYKEIGSSYSNASKEEKKMLKDMALNIQDEFINTVDRKRNLTPQEVSKIKTARIFLGKRAKKLGLVDRLGGRATAVNVAEGLSGKDLKLEEVQTSQNFSLLSLFLSKTGIGGFLESFGLDSGVKAPLAARY